MTLVKEIARMGRDSNDQPYRPVKIIHITITKVEQRPQDNCAKRSTAKPAVKNQPRQQCDVRETCVTAAVQRDLARDHNYDHSTKGFS